MTPVQVKICGVTNRDDALAAVRAGADWLGVNLWPGSKRYVSIDEAEGVLAEVPAGVRRVGVFVDQPRAEIERAIEQLRLDAVQLHGRESPEDCAGLPARVIKSLAPDAAAESPRYAVDFILLDTRTPSGFGGTGETFPWDRADGVAPGRLFLAGGLDPGNVVAAIRRVRPFAVDVAGGVERDPRHKDWKRLEEFVRHAKAA